MHTNRVAGLVLLVLLQASVGYSDDLIFEDKFEKELSAKWKIEGLKKEDYRIVDGGFEMRVQPGELTDKTPCIRYLLPANAPQHLKVSVKVTVLNRFSKDKELAGVYLFDKTGLVFGGQKQRVDGKLVFSPGDYIFRGKPGEEGDSKKYIVKYTPESADAGPLGVLIEPGNAFFQVGPSKKDEYLTFFMSAIQDEAGRGFSLVAAGAPDKEAHWVRFDDFRVRGW